MSAPHARTGPDVAAELGSDAARGLAAADAAERLGRFGRNELPERPPPTWVELVARQLRDALVLLLLGAAVISVAVGDPLDSALIVAIVVLNTILGAVQEGRAESAAASVRALLPARAHAVREGRVVDLDAAELVPGDVVVLKAGDHVPADGRITDAHDTDIDESLLTGESMPVSKRADPPVGEATPLAERATMAYSGTTVARGRARVLVTATGTATEAGQTAELAGEAAPATPLQQRLDRLAASLLRAIVAICLLLTLLSWAHGERLTDALLTGVSLAVAAVPEGLAVVVTLTSALGVRRLARRRGIVRRLRAAETLGSVSVICTDKTGTLTTNRMAVDRTHALADGPDEDAEALLLRAGVLASDPSGDPEDRAIATYARERGVGVADLHESARVVGGHPFDAERKRMSVVVEDDRGRRRAFVKGAPEVLAPRIASPAAREELERVARAWSSEGVRVLLVGERELGDDDGADEEDGLVARGAIGMWDPPRESAAPSVEAARSAGIRPIMVTGDHPRTAAAVASLCGIGAEAAPRVVSGPELDALSDDELRRLVTETDVFARVVPAHKLRVVQTLVDSGEVVAVTGDGVNDVPALRASHVGVAMGQGGTDAAIDAADVVLADNDFATIVTAVEEGRTIYRNILRFLQFLLAGNAGEVLAFTLAVPAGLGAPLTVPQILLVNLLFDGPPAVALGVDPADPSVMKERPRPLSEGVLEPIRRNLAIGGVITGLAVFASFLIGREHDAGVAVTMAFTTLAFSRLLYVFTIRTDGWLWRGARNPALVLAALASGTTATGVLLLRPLHDVFDIVPMGATQLAAALALALIPAGVVEALKARRRGGHPA